MPTYILHIGSGKTGSTALQRFMAHNRERLWARGILYPDIRMWGSWMGLHDHNLFGQALAGKRTWHRFSAADYWEQFEAQHRDAAHVKQVVLSAETLLGLPHPWESANDLDYWSAQSRKLGKLRELLSDQPASIVVYLRRQDHWLEAAINQTIKYEATMPSRVFESPQQFSELMEPRLNYEKMLEPWSRVFGDESMRVRVYEPDQLTGGDVITDFLMCIGIEDRQILAEPLWNADAKNESLPRDLLEFKRSLNSIARPKYEERFLAHALRAIAARDGIRMHRQNPVLSASFRRALLKRYEESNRQVAARYLSRDDEVLFNEPWPKRDAAPDLGEPSTERLAEIAALLEQYRYSFKGQSIYWRLRGGAIIRRHAPWLRALLHRFK